jgi:hypothetical protein
MSWRKNLQKLSHRQLRELASLCAGAAFLAAVALLLSGPTSGLPFNFNMLSHGSQVAATALGDLQGVPPGYTGKTYPADTTCWVNYSYLGYGPNWTPLCPTIGNSYFPQPPNRSNTFSTGIFSINPTGSTAGESVYINSTYVPVAYTVQGPYLGNAGISHADCNPYIHKLPAGYSAASGDYVDDGVAYYDGNGDPVYSCYAYHSNGAQGPSLGPPDSVIELNATCG